MDFEKCIKGFEKALENKFAAECLFSIQNETILFKRGFSKSAEELTSLYDFRLRNAKHKKRHSNFEIESWEYAIHLMKNTSCKTFHLNIIHSEKHVYFIFWNTDTEKLVSIISFDSRKSLSETEKYYDQDIQKGLTTNLTKYFKQKKVKEW